MPTALRAVGLKDVDFLQKNGLVTKGTPDKDWLPRVGSQGYLVFSCNTGMLNAEEERNLLVQHKVGIVFLTTGQATGFQMLKLVLHHWGWLETVDAQPRPFVYKLSLRGRKARVPLD
ncbi:MAG: hypothetical protein HY331_13665 [Chloroflexi bacterium]|nr:hypothetical protein [Chloroflexota bacterium]